MTEKSSTIVVPLSGVCLDEIVNPWHGIAKIAERLGVQPLEGRKHRPTVTVSGAETLPLHGGSRAPSYDLFEVVEAVLDRLDRIERGGP
ncbi:hypothetical protein AB7M45_007874 [Bradyrhizobium elkanii]|uniref:hypothetical protein n=1 Tax=Bradyrhizobium elkanii TaxID=29448 RepID=UPI0009168D93|nr:hypothetical protein [Bradyrhizobium elkanii]MCW2195103.1 hypothetical protein [Bradyrhizobium elkanii]NWL67205.1 hypothetical protein [Bradyrhizobium elkanii]OIM94124.1 hypothetical protein BLN97_12695 [Bradyrhizobium elkanii]